MEPPLPDLTLTAGPILVGEVLFYTMSLLVNVLFGAIWSSSVTINFGIGSFGKLTFLRVLPFYRHMDISSESL